MIEKLIAWTLPLIVIAGLGVAAVVTHPQSVYSEAPLGEPFAIDNAQIVVLYARIGRLCMIERGNEYINGLSTGTTRVGFVLRYQITNTSSTTSLGFKCWQYNKAYNGDPVTNTFISDANGRRYKPLVMPEGYYIHESFPAVDSLHPSRSVSPGETIERDLFFEPPPASARIIRAQLNANAFRGIEGKSFKFLLGS